MRHTLENNEVRAIIESCYNHRRESLVRLCYKITLNEEVAKDCVQEAFVTVLSLPEDTFESENQVRAWVYLTAKSLAVSSLRHKLVRRKHANKLERELYPGVEDANNGVFNYYPVDTKAIEGLKQLKGNAIVAAISYMHSIPLNKVSKAMGMRENGLHTNLQTAIRQIKRFVESGTTKRQAVNKDGLTDSIYNLVEHRKIPVKDAAAMLNLSIPAAHNRLWRARHIIYKTN